MTELIERGRQARTCACALSDCVVALLEAGADVPLELVKTSFQLSHDANDAAAQNQVLLARTDEVKAAFAEHTVVTDDNKNALLLACASVGLVHRLRVILEAGANAAYTDEDGCTALMLACSNKHEAAAAVLVEATKLAGALDLTGRDGNTALELATDAATFECLRAAGAKMPDITIYNRNALLLRYADNGHALLLSAALQAGANVDCTGTAPNFTPVLALVTSCDVLQCKFCLSNIRLLTSLYTCLRAGHNCQRQQATIVGCWKDSRWYEIWQIRSMSPLHLAAMGGYSSVVVQLFGGGRVRQPKSRALWPNPAGVVRGTRAYRGGEAAERGKKCSLLGLASARHEGRPRALARTQDVHPIF